MAAPKRISLFGKLNPLVFFLAFGVGLLFTYATVPKPEVVIKFPTPSNAGKVVYRADDGDCYKYSAEEVACPADQAAVRIQPF